jgi:hypothetical protein
MTLRDLPTHMFWAYGDLSNLERLCCASFVSHGYDLNLWSYGHIRNAPPGVVLKDAREILGEEFVFLNAWGSYAGFSDLFRYAVLNKVGGLYADTDVIALEPPRQLPDQAFLCTERTVNADVNGALKLNGNVMFNPAPQIGNLIDLALAFSLRFPKNDVTWGELGPDLLTAIASLYKKHGFLVFGPEFANPVNYWNCPNHLLATGRKLPENAAFLHCYNEMWRREGADKNQAYPEGSIMSTMAKKYLQHPG